MLELETSPWLFSLPRWARKDQMLRQTLGLRIHPSEETFAQRWERIQEKYRDRIVPNRSPASASSFTSFGTDNYIIRSPEDLHVDQKPNMLGSSVTRCKSAISRYFDPHTFRAASKAYLVGSMRSKDSKMSRPWQMSPGDNERCSTGEGSFDHYAIHGCARASPTRPFGAMSPSLTPPTSPELIHQSVVAAGAKRKNSSSISRAHKIRRVLRNDVLSQASEPVFFELDHSGKTIMFRALPWGQRLHREMKPGEGRVEDKIASDGSASESFNWQPHHGHTSAQTTLKRKRMTQNT